MLRRLHTKLDVPHYGVVVAGDTGHRIKGAMVDLGFPEDATNAWSTHYVDIYLVEPVPSPPPMHLP